MIPSWLNSISSSAAKLRGYRQQWLASCKRLSVHPNNPRLGSRLRTTSSQTNSPPASHPAGSSPCAPVQSSRTSAIPTVGSAPSRCALYEDDDWQPRPIDGAAATIEKRTVSIPPNVWHRIAIGPETFVSLSFHT